MAELTPDGLAKLVYLFLFLLMSTKLEKKIVNLLNMLSQWKEPNSFMEGNIRTAVKKVVALKMFPIFYYLWLVKLLVTYYHTQVMAV